MLPARPLIPQQAAFAGRCRLWGTYRFRKQGAKLKNRPGRLFIYLAGGSHSQKGRKANRNASGGDVGAFCRWGYTFMFRPSPFLASLVI
jgi:hypothetical protein